VKTGLNERFESGRDTNGNLDEFIFEGGDSQTTGRNRPGIDKIIEAPEKHGVR
jgi:hypothetical protein